MGINTISFDIDPLAVEKNYLESIKNKERNILPLLMDITNPSPAIGWANHERMSLIERGPVETVFALALVHHLAISNNVPFAKIADFFRNICNNLIIEFVEKNDSQVQKLLLSRKDIFPDYRKEKFEEEFLKFFNIVQSRQIGNMNRTLYLMKRNYSDCKK